MLPTPCIDSSTEIPEKHHKVRRELMVSHALSLLVSLTGLTGPCWDHRARTQMDNYAFWKLLSVPALNLETCGSQFPALFTHSPWNTLSASGFPFHSSCFPGRSRSNCFCSDSYLNCLQSKAATQVSQTPWLTHPLFANCGWTKQGVEHRPPVPELAPKPFLLWT